MFPDQQSLKRDFYPVLLQRNSGKAWLLVLIAMLLGAGLGYLSTLFLSPVYEGKAILSMNMELVPGNNITEIMVDAEINHIGELAWHPDVLSSLFAAESAIDEESLRRNGSVERQLMNTVLKYRSADSSTAANVATSWASSLFERIQAAYPYALKVSQAKELLTAIEDCRLKPENTILPFCIALNEQNAATMISEANLVIEENFSYSLGLTKDLNPGSVIPAANPAPQVANRRGALILAGTLAGFSLGVVLTELLPRKKRDEI